MAVAVDLTEAVEVGETTARGPVAGFGAAADAGLADTEDESGLEVDGAGGGLFVEEERALEGAAGAIDARRAGPVTVDPVEGALPIWLGLVGDAGVAALTDFFNADVAEAGLAAVDVAVAGAAFAAGAAFMFPAPKVPEFRI